MKTKLVYVLTCAPDKHYIEQAHISLFSARSHNPDAHIVLIVDQSTDVLFAGKRADLLQYVSEKIVVDVPSHFNVMQASRWIKTSVRNLIDGDFLFIDCDTIIAQSLESVDQFDCEIGAVLDCHRKVSRFSVDEQEELIAKAKKCGWDFTDVDEYYSSGVVYVKDSNTTRQFYQLWHQNYLHSAAVGVSIDQLSLEKSKQSLSVVTDIDDVWNTIMFTRPSFVYEAKIMHCASLDNNVFLFSNRVLSYINMNGLTDYIKESILNPHTTFLPYRKEDFVGMMFFKNIIQIAEAVDKYATNIDADLLDVRIPSRFAKNILLCYKHKLYLLGTAIWFFYIKITGKYNPLEKYFN